MRLNADIIFDNLKDQLPVEMFGYKSEGLTLTRPEFFVEGDKAFQSGHLYVVPGELISRRANMEKGAVIVCIGDFPQMSYLSDRCCFIKVKEDRDLFKVFNAVQGIFNRYDSWNDTLNHILEDSASVQEMLEVSIPVFKNPIMALDSSFRFIAHAGYEGLEDIVDAFENLSEGELSISALTQYLGQGELLTHVRTPILFNILDTTSLSMNIFDGEEYTGSVSVEYRSSPHLASHDALIEILASYVLLAVKRNSSLVMNDRNVLRKVFLNIINGLPVDTSHRKYLDTIKADKQFICTVLQLKDRFAQIPVDYVCTKFNSVFPKSITFENRSDIISFIEVEDLIATSSDGPWTREDYQEILESQISVLAGSMDIKVGISSDFSDPYSARLYYLQAQSALENGTLTHPDYHYYYFEDFALMELVINSQSDLPLDMYYSKGLRRLFDHDKTSPISYIETLKTYLNNNMSVTKTAAELYVHRSTLLERLSRIDRELGEDLKDPDVRLQIQIVLKALEIEERISESSGK